MNKSFVSALDSRQSEFGLTLSPEAVERFGHYYDLVQRDNRLLHLVAPCDPAEFAVRHVLESLFVAGFLGEGGVFADVGSGAGLPAIPLLLLRDDLSAVLIESKAKKARFLRRSVEELGIANRASVENSRFEDLPVFASDAILIRALDKFGKKLPKIIRWASGRPLILFGGPGLGEALDRLGTENRRELIPLSRQRFVFFAG